MERTDWIRIHGLKAWPNFVVFLCVSHFYESQYFEGVMRRFENHHGSSLLPKSGNEKVSVK